MGDWRLGVHADAPFEERLERYTIPVPFSGCWIWLGSVTTHGYGYFQGKDRKKVGAHCASYEHFVGPISDGLQIDHLCRVRCCVNPDHLEAVTQRENLLRGDNHWRSKTHCPRGHPYSGDNLLVRDNGIKINRRCRICHNASANIARTRRRLECQIVGDPGPMMDPQHLGQL